MLPLADDPTRQAARRDASHIALNAPTAEGAGRQHEQLVAYAAARMPAFFRVMKQVGKRLAEEFSPDVARLGAGQFRALHALFDAGRLQVGDLAEQCGVADPTISKLLRSVEQQG